MIVDNSVKIIGALGGVKFFITLTILILGIIYRDPIRTAVTKGTNIILKRGDLQASITSSESEQKKASQSEAENAVGRTSKNEEGELKEDDIEETIADQSEDKDDNHFSKMLSAIKKGDKKTADAELSLWLASEQNPCERLRAKSMYHYESFLAGNMSAMKDLDELLSQTDRKADKAIVYTWMGHAYSRVDNHTKAFQAYEAAHSHSEAVEDKARISVFSAIEIYEQGKIDLALSRVEKEIAATSEDNALAILYEGLADVYKREKSYFLRSLALEKALEYNPTSSSSIFDTAYAYSEADNNELALLHYQNLIRSKKDHEYGWNNLGVVYSNLKMPILAVNAYQKSFELGETLAASNLAYKLIQEGFVEEARDIIAKAREKEDIDERVEHASSHLAKQITQQDEKKADALQEAAVLQRFYKNYGQAYFTQSEPLDLAGWWKLPKTYGVRKIDQEGNNIEAKWQADEKKYTLTGTIHNKSVSLSIRYPIGSYSTDTEHMEGFQLQIGDTLTLLRSRKIEEMKKELPPKSSSPAPDE